VGLFWARNLIVTVALPSVRRLEAGAVPRVAERAGGAGGADGDLRLLHREHHAGRRIYATGGNEKAAKLSGIRTDRLVFWCFVNMGALAALAGMIVTARLNSATPKAGVGFELDVIAAVFIGGASMAGGSGKIIGVVVGALIMGVMNNGMSILGIGIDYQQVIKGLVLLAAVIFDVYNKNK
jgi:putative multiple sugar transport system permease protein